MLAYMRMCVYSCVQERSQKKKEQWLYDFIFEGINVCLWICAMYNAKRCGKMLYLRCCTLNQFKLSENLQEHIS